MGSEMCIRDSTGGATLLDGMPQPEGWTHSSLRPVPTHHTVPSCGWMVHQDAMAGKFDRARADDLQLSSKQRAMLARGEDVLDGNGDTLEAAWFRGGQRDAVSVLISGDTASAPSAWDASVSPTLLIHEATFLEEQQDKADEHLHSTAAGAVASAQSVGATYLCLLYTSPSPRDLSTSRMPSSA